MKPTRFHVTAQHLQAPAPWVEQAFARAKKASNLQGKSKQEQGFHRKKTVIFIASFTGAFSEKMIQCVKGFPDLDSLPPFFLAVLPETLSVVRLKKALSQLTAAATLIERIKKNTIRAMRGVSGKGSGGLEKIKGQCIARTISVMESLEDAIAEINGSLKKLRELPSIDMEAYTLVLAGFPNTGKSTLLNMLTGSRARVESFPFTTTSLMLGSFTQRFRVYQVIDTPGLLDRPLQKTNAIERKALAALKHLAKCVVFVFDATGHCGYSMEQQLALLRELQKTFSVQFCVVLSKTDMGTPAQFAEARELLKPHTILESSHASPLQPAALIKAATISSAKSLPPHEARPF